MSFVDFFSQEQLQNFLRPTISQGLSQAIAAQEWRSASLHLRGFIDTWAIGGCIRQAWERWNHGCDPMSLSVLSRANQIITLVKGTPLIIPAPKELPPYLEMNGHALVERRETICAQALRGEIDAVYFTSPVPLLPQAQLALGELRMEAKAQRSLEEFGPVGLLAPESPSWEGCFGPAPSGRMGENLRLMCDLALLPSTPNRLEKGQLQETGWLLWNGPARALPVHRVAYEILKNISQGIEHACAAVDLPVEQGTEIIGELVSIGALDRVS
jgi:hypothetical protein